MEVQDNQEDSTKQEKDILKDVVPFYRYLNLDKFNTLFGVAIIRFLMGISLTLNHVYPDEYWQGTEVAYNIVYGGVDLPWEWQPQYKLRNVLYPYFLAIPMWLMKLLGVDTFYMVRVAPYFAHSVLVILGDYYFYQVGKKLFGIQTTRVAFIFYFTNVFFNSHLIRCFSNSVETILHLIVFNYYLEIENRLDKNLGLVAFCLSISLGIRNTSIIGWLPLLVYKMIKKDAIDAFLQSALLVALPTLLGVIVIDSIYYKSFACTAYNFLVVNVLENRSAEFGVSSRFEFITNYIPKNIGLLLILVYPGILYNIYVCHNKREVPLAAMFVLFYLMIISNVPHKEERFMHPILPFLFLMAAQVVVVFLKIRIIGRILGIVLILHGIYCTFRHVGKSVFDGSLWQPLDFILATDHQPHSFYHMNKYDAPLYTWAHRQSNEKQIKVFSTNRGPPFVRTANDSGIPIQYRLGLNEQFCIEMVAELLSAKIRPKYLIINKYSIRNQMYSYYACVDGVKKWYEEVQQFPKFNNKEWWGQFFQIQENYISVWRLKKEYKPYY